MGGQPGVPERGTAGYGMGLNVCGLVPAQQILALVAMLTVITVLIYATMGVQRVGQRHVVVKVAVPLDVLTTGIIAQQTCVVIAGRILAA